MSQAKVNTKKAVSTGNPPTLNVAIEQNFPLENRIMTDELAPQLFSGTDKFWIKLSKYAWVRNWLVNMKEKFFSGGWSGFIVRKRYIDEKLLEVLDKNEVSQAVNLGAGLDTRFYRFKEAESIKVWEFDQIESANYKRKVMTKALGAFPAHINLFGIDFIKQKVEEVLAENGFSSAHKTFYVMEAVSQYLDESTIKSTFEFFAKAAAGSHLAFTYVPKDFVTGDDKLGEELMYKLTVKTGMWHTGLDPAEVSGFLANYGWELIEDVDYSELNNRFVKPTGRNLSAMKVERMVYAVKK